MTVVCAMLWRVVGGLDDETTKRDDLLCRHHHLRLSRRASRRATATPGSAIDVLGLRRGLMGPASTRSARHWRLLGMWLFSDAITRQARWRTVLLWLDRAWWTEILSLPEAGAHARVEGLDRGVFGFGARTIAIIDAAVTSPFAQLSMIPLLTLCAIYAPRAIAPPGLR